MSESKLHSPSDPDRFGQKPSRWRRFKEFFTPPEVNTPQTIPGDTPQDADPTSAEQAYIRRTLHDLQNTGEPPAHNIPLDAINIRRELPVNWDALTNLGMAVNRTKKKRVTDIDIASLEPPEAAYRGIPMVASVVANAADPEFPLSLPTDADIKAIKPWLHDVSQVIGLFSERLQGKFDKYIERRGQELVKEVGLKIHDVAQVFAHIEHPQDQLRVEIYRIYTKLLEPQYRPDDSLFAFFGEGDIEVTVEQKINDFIHVMRAYSDGYSPEHAVPWFQKKDFPLLTKILPIVKFPPQSLDIDTASVAGAEMMQGVEHFLRAEGFRDIPPAPQTTEYDLFDLLTFSSNAWNRTLAEWFKHGQLEEVRQKLPDILHYGKEALPKSGPQFTQSVYTIARNIVLSNAQEDQMRK